MHDLKLIRTQPDVFDACLKKRGLAPQATALLAKDETKRTLQTGKQNLEAERNRLAKAFGAAKAKGEDAEPLRAESEKLREQIAGLEAEMVKAEEALTYELCRIPNLPAEDVPLGANETGNKEVRVHGTKPVFDFTPKEHFDLGEALGLLDFETAGKISGARFAVLKGALAKLERALAAFMLDIHTESFGYTEILPPYLVREAALFGTGQLPKFAEDLFRTTDDYWLIPTAEVSLTNLVNDTIVAEAQLPLRFTAHTPCFRAEAGSAGKDTRGMIRQHQFSKVELVSICKPEDSFAEHERMTACAEEVLKRLGLHYRVMLLCTGDMGFSAQKTYDLEVWLPGQNAFREISSCSNCGDFQARRMKARFKGAKGNEFVHTLNGSGLAVGRTIVAVLENYQQKDGSIRIPDALVPYMNGKTAITAHV